MLFAYYLRFKLASFQPELQECTSRTTFVDFEPELQECASRTTFLHVDEAIVRQELQECASSTNSVRAIANFELDLRERASCTTTVFKNCDFAVGALGVLFRVLLLDFKLASFQPELRKCALHTFCT